MNLKIKKLRWVTSCIKHLAISGLSSVLARIKSSCNLIANRFEMPNVSYTQPLCIILITTIMELTGVLHPIRKIIL